MTKNLLPKNADWIEIVETTHARGMDDSAYAPVENDRAWATRIVDAVRPVFARSPLVGMFLGEHDESMRGWRSMIVG